VIAIVSLAVAAPSLTVKVTAGYVPACVKLGVQLNVPDVLVPFAVNVAPAGSGAAVSDVIVSPSGSTADTVNVIGEFEAPETEGGAVTTGARSVFVTVIVVVAEPVRAFVAVKVALYVPACVKLGVQLSVPDVFEPFFVKTAPAVMAVPVAVRFVIASPSGSDAETNTVKSEFSATVAVAGAVTTGARSTLVTTICVVAEPERAFVAVNVTLYVPAWVKLGVHENVPDVLPEPGVNVAPAGSGAAVRLVIASASGSTADTVKVISEFSAPETLAGAVTTGARSPFVTVMTVVAEPVRAFVAVNVTLNVPV